MNLVSEWNKEGDAERNAVSSIRSGSEALIAFRYESSVHDGEQRLNIEISVADKPGGQIVSRTLEINRIVEGTGRILNERAVRFPTGRWRAGEKRAEVVIRDEITGMVSEPKATSFEVREPTPRG